MGKFNLNDYAEVKDRIEEFVKDFSTGSIQTFLRSFDGPEVVFEARIFRTPEDVMNGVYTSGFAREVEGKSPVNKTSHVENCETSAIGRALANMGYGTDANRASRSEMLKVARMNEELEEFLDFIRDHYETLSETHTGTINGNVVNLKDFIEENGKKLKEQYKLARAVVTAIEGALGVSLSPKEAE